MIEYLAASHYARLAVLLTLFACVGGLSLIAMLAMSRRVTVRSELRSLAGLRSERAVQTLRERRDDQWTRLADRIEKVGLSLTDSKADRLRERMVAAGFDSPAAPRMYTLIRLLLVILLPSAYVGLILWSGTEISFFKLYIMGSIAALAGLYVPALVVQAKIDRRREAIVNGFPDSLDLMLICVEAGLGLEAALDRVGREVSLSQPLVAKMLTTATLQLRAGASRETALRKMADSVRVNEIASFATLLIQSDKLGTSIATTLRIYAAEMREKRRMRAEEKAHRIPVLISIPLVTCMLPVMIGILMLPAAIRVIRQVVPAMGG
jgi:tight adherence protein C